MKTSRKGFTLVELLIVVAIWGILSVSMVSWRRAASGQSQRISRASRQAVIL